MILRRRSLLSRLVRAPGLFLTIYRRHKSLKLAAEATLWHVTGAVLP